MMEDLKSGWHLAAAVALAALCLVHVFAGGREMRAILLDPDARTVRYAWHLVTIALAIMAAGYLLAAYHATQWALELTLNTLATCFALWAAGLCALTRGAETVPHAVAFALVAALGWIGTAA